MNKVLVIIVLGGLVYWLFFYPSKSASEDEQEESDSSPQQSLPKAIVWGVNRPLYANYPPTARIERISEPEEWLLRDQQDVWGLIEKEHISGYIFLGHVRVNTVRQGIPLVNSVVYLDHELERPTSVTLSAFTPCLLIEETEDAVQVQWSAKPPLSGWIRKKDWQEL